MSRSVEAWNPWSIAMTDSKKELEELKALQREAKAPRKRAGTRKAKRPATPKASASQSKPGSARATTRAAEVQPPEEEEVLDPGLADELDDLVSELEEAAISHPTLALLAAFGIGVVVGHLLNRK